VAFIITAVDHDADGYVREVEWFSFGSRGIGPRYVVDVLQVVDAIRAGEAVNIRIAGSVRGGVRVGSASSGFGTIIDRPDARQGEQLGDLPAICGGATGVNQIRAALTATGTRP
jgi:hypothetical protein